MKKGLESQSYLNAGVDIRAANVLIEKIKPAVYSTKRPGVLSGIGGFAGLFDLKESGYSDPILAAATDGVGTKLRIAIDTHCLQGIGIDLVAMCVNDLICQGAEPLFFLDYFATGKLRIDEITQVIESIAKGCRQSGCALIGGETAEMPGMYDPGDFDLAGFSVGVMERGQNLPKNLEEGDMLIGLTSSGLHSNGFSLVRRVIEKTGLHWRSDCPWNDLSLGRSLLEPTRIYVRTILNAHRAGYVKGIANVTGGGLTENIPRILPTGLGVQINLNSWSAPEVFHWLHHNGQISEREMLRTFNVGIGMVLVVSRTNINALIALLESAGETIAIIGQLVPGKEVTYTGELF
ncbi:MAG: phosphoribosylformylglycinamidine cyclo-ligase [Aestuariivita sp.]|nr:phosphoribosylformylglycinamidine cyclo-ligase [Aestuariivita sp.]